MINSEGVPANASSATLPYGTDDRDILRLIEAIKKKPDNEKAIKEIYNKSNFETSRKTLEILGILDGQFRFSKDGKELAIEKEGSRRQELFLKFFLLYPPYGHLLESLFHDDMLSVTETDSIKDYWWKHNYGSSGNNRDEGVVAFCKLIQLAGLGKFVTGRKGKPSRIEWDPNAKAWIDKACTPIENALNLGGQLEIPASDQEHTDESTSTANDTIEISGEVPTDVKTYTEKSPLSQLTSPHTALSLIPNSNISISVDMSEWDIDKITAFFKAAYGIFDDD